MESGVDKKIRKYATGAKALLASVALLAIWGTVGCGVTGKPGATNNSNNAASANSNNSQSSTASTSSTGQLVASSSTVNFGTETVGQASSQLVSVTNKSTANITIGTVTASPSVFGSSAGSNITLAPNQMLTLSVSFAPSAAGNAAGTLSIASSASNSVLQIALTGAGTTTPQSSVHNVDLNWTPSSSSVNGYYVYRGTTSGGPYTKLNASYETAPAFTDGSAQGGATYYYVVTSVDASNVESGFSNQVIAAVP